jgi:Tfp pilus assembly protein PilF
MRWRLALFAFTLASTVVAQDARDFDNAVAFMKQRKFASAQEILERLVKDHPDNLEARNNLAVCLIKAGKFAEAETHLQRVLKTEPARAGSVQNLGVARQGQKDPLKALEHTGEAIRLFGTQSRPSAYRIAHALYNRGWIQHEQGKLPEAARTFQEAIKHHPQYARAWLELAIVEAKAGNFADARKAFSEAERWQREDPDVPLLLEPNRKALDELDPQKPVSTEVKKEPEPAASKPKDQVAESPPAERSFIRDGLFGGRGWWTWVAVLAYIVYCLAAMGTLGDWARKNYEQQLTGEERTVIFLVSLAASVVPFFLCWGLAGGFGKWSLLILITALTCGATMSSPRKRR